jgi:hypothetical protein
MALLPFTGTTGYKQTPFETITEERYEYLCKFSKKLDLRDVTEDNDNTDLSGELACSGDKGCEII